MKKSIKSFISFTRTERIGLICLCAFIIILIAIRITMPLWAHPDTDKEKQQRLVAAWDSFKRSQPIEKTIDTTWGNEVLQPVIDLNAADSATLTRIAGIGPVTAGKIVARRKNKGPFTNLDQLSDVDFFSTDTLALLKKRLIINSNKQP